MAPAPELSVLTVTRNRREIVLRKLDALARQELEPERFELVVCVNGDEQGSYEALTARAVGLPFALRLLRFEENRGAAAGRNACAAAARGAVLYLSDDDALPAPATLARHLAAQRVEPGLYQGDVRCDAPDGTREWIRAPRRLRFWHVHGVNTSVPRAVFERVGGFDEWLEGYGHEDVLFGYKAWRAGAPLRPLADAAAVHLGPNPVRAGPATAPKARSAGRNAARIARRYPELAFRLGAHPLSVAAKRLALGPLGGLWRRLDPPSHAYERAYLQGILEERRDP